jgi:hypothetical protein
VYDPPLDVRRVFWIDPATNFSCQQIGKAVGLDIVQEGGRRRILAPAGRGARAARVRKEQPP